MSLRLIVVPYHLGHRNVGMGAGPERLLEAGAESALALPGYEASIVRIEDDHLPGHEVGATFELNRRLASAVKTAVTEGVFPLVLAGNCNSSLGTLSGVGMSDIGVVWFDAHGDFNTPESSVSGFFDGMCLNMVTGGCWQGAAHSIPGFKPVAPDRAALLGVRDLDPVERELLERCDLSVVDCRTMRESGLSKAMVAALDSIGMHVRDVYVHVDLDVLNGDTFSVNEFSAPGGLSPNELNDVLCVVGERFNVVAAAVTAYDPSYDVADTVSNAALEVIATLASLGNSFVETKHGQGQK